VRGLPGAQPVCLPERALQDPGKEGAPVNENTFLAIAALTTGTAWTTVKVTAAILRHRATMRRESARAGGAT
jgi:hypothetical protein